MFSAKKRNGIPLYRLARNGITVNRGPISVKVDQEGHMLIPDFGSHRIQVYKKEAYPLTADQIAPELRNPVLFTT